MAAFGDADLTMMLADAFSVPVSYAGTPASGIYTDRTVPALTTDGASVQLRERFVDVAAGALTDALAEDAAITVDGTAYRVREFGPIEDGRIVRVHLAKV